MLGRIRIGVWGIGWFVRVSHMEADVGGEEEGWGTEMGNGE